ncbi:hypothetical protein MBLNU230_g2423t1 [Neophaeotheca triangularis]
MAEEPQPSNVTEGADAPDVVPANAEDRKAAAAMSSLDTRGEDETKPKKDVDMKAVQEAMKNLETGTQPQGKAMAVESSKKKEEAPKKPLVKVDAADITLIGEQLDLSKPKATELLRAHDADAIKAMTAWVTSTS